MTPELALPLALLAPLVGCVVALAFASRPLLRDRALLAVSPLGLIPLVSLYPVVVDGGRPRLEVFTLLPGIPLAFEVEPLGLLYALVAAGLWVVTALYATGYMCHQNEPRRGSFFFFFALAIAAAMGIAFAANLITLFLFYELLTLCTFPLVTHRRTAFARDAGRVYLGLLLTTSIAFLLLAIAWTWVLAGTVDFRPGGILAGRAGGGTLAVLLGLFFFGAGKAALMPFHRWLPRAMVAPAPVSALLHAVAVVKAGVFTILKVVVYVFGLDLLAGGLSIWLAWVAAGTILLASVIALRKDNLKARLAYSTISQLGYIVLGAALATSASVAGAGMHIAMHAFGKITLFFCAGAIYARTHAIELKDMDGIGRRMPWTMGAFAVASLTIIGLPPGGGMWSKWALLSGALDAGQPVLFAVLLVSSLLSVAYLMPIVARAFFLRPAEVKHPHFGPHDPRCDLPDSPQEGIQEAPLSMVVALCITAAGSVVLFFFAGPVAALLAPITTVP